MSLLRSTYELENKTEQLENKTEQLENKTEQLENKTEQLENKTEQLENKTEQLGVQQRWLLNSDNLIAFTHFGNLDYNYYKSGVKKFMP